MRRKPLPIGKTFGRLTVVSLARHDKTRGAYHFACNCECGGSAVVREDCLTTRNTSSCGCLQPESVPVKHGMHKTRTYRIWAGMKRRCADYSAKKSHLYSRKGITVCAEWKDFERFLEDMGESPEGMSIERLDGNKGYFKENCVWATPKEQANNTSANKRITFQGETKTLSLWAESLGIKANTLLYRLRRGWTVERAFTATRPCLGS